MDSHAALPSVVTVTLAGLELSVLLSTFLYAITSCQVFVYWRSKFHDRPFIRYLVR